MCVCSRATTTSVRVLCYHARHRQSSRCAYLSLAVSGLVAFAGDRSRTESVLLCLFFFSQLRTSTGRNTAVVWNPQLSVFCTTSIFDLSERMPAGSPKLLPYRFMAALRRVRVVCLAARESELAPFLFISRAICNL